MVSTDTRRTSTAAHFASAIRSHDIIAEVAPLAGGSLRAKTETWASYWQPVQWLGGGTLVSALDRFERARAQYTEALLSSQAMSIPGRIQLRFRCRFASSIRIRSWPTMVQAC
jgi:hypothetical protein